MIRNQIDSPSGKFLFVGDIHGDVLSLRRALRLGKDQEAATIFVGDYIDSHLYTRAEQKKCLEIVKEHQNDEHVYFLKGNHELAYLKPQLYNIHGYSRSFHREIAHLVNSISFYSYLTIDDHILITHAGLSRRFMENEWSYNSGEYGSDGELLRYVGKAMREEQQDETSAVFKAGQLSRGDLEVGGPFWCRVSKFEPIGNDIIQIFGHTNISHIRYYSHRQAYNVDALLGNDCQVLLYDKHSSSFSIRTLI